MAKKFAAIEGFHNVYTQENGIYQIDVDTVNENINYNTVCFVTADETDRDNYVGNHRLTPGENFIIVRKDIYSLYNGGASSEIQNTWRPIYVGGELATDSNILPVNFSTNSSVLSVSSSLSSDMLSVLYDIDMQALEGLIESKIPTIPDVNDGKLLVNIEKEDVHSEQEGVSTFVEVTPNTISVDVEPANVPHDPPTPEDLLQPGLVFTANTADDRTVKIHYKGNADRVDWYVEKDSRTESDPNNSEAKKFIYIECLQEYFYWSEDYPYLMLNDKGNSVISPDSIVFITCGSIVSDGRRISDAEAFGNPEYYPGARFIWTHNRMFSANTWLPIFTRETENYELKGITPPIGTSPHGGRLIFQGAGGITVDNTTNEDDLLGLHDRIITIDGSGLGQGEAGTIYTTTVLVKEDIPIGGTHLGDRVLEEGLFSDCGNVVPANMTLHEVLTRLLYREEPVIPYYIGVVGPGYNNDQPLVFTDDQDITSIINGNSTTDENNVAQGTTIMFKQFNSSSLDPIAEPMYSGHFNPCEYFKYDYTDYVPDFRVKCEQFIVLAPKEKFVSNIADNWLEVKSDGASWTHLDDTGLKAYFNTVRLNGKDYLSWTVYGPDDIASANEFRITFQRLK